MIEAFEKARAAYGSGAYDDATLEFLFPQLKESEDERIIGNIKKAAELYWSDESLDEILSWLEKQKEQTSDIILKAFENSKTDYSLEERKEASDYSEKVLPTSIAYGESEEEYLLHKVIEAAYIAGQKEQKPLSTKETELNSIAFLEQPEVDLEKEYQEFCKDHPFPWSSQYVNREYIDELCLSVARHFYKLGRKARKEDK